MGEGSGPEKGCGGRGGMFLQFTSCIMKKIINLVSKEVPQLVFFVFFQMQINALEIGC